MSFIQKSFSYAVAMLFAVLLFTACEQNPIPDAGTTVSTSFPEFKTLAKQMTLDCKRIDCCVLDGIETSCSLVYACLDAGFCQVVAMD